MPMVKMVPRGFTAAADAYLTPHILRWVGVMHCRGAKNGYHDVRLFWVTPLTCIMIRV